MKHWTDQERGFYWKIIIILIDKTEIIRHEGEVLTMYVF